MKLNFRKLVGGVLSPADEMIQEKMQKFKNNELYEVEIKLVRNPKFLSKMFVFFHFAFDHWDASNKHPYLDESAQFEMFRQELTAIAGYRDECYRIDGSVKVTAKSLSFGNMDEDEFGDCYHAIVNAAMRTIFKGCDKSVENKIISFF